MFTTEKKQQILPAQGSTFTSTVITVESHRTFSAQISFANGSGFTADIELQASNDQDNWETITDSDVTITGTSGSQIYDVFDSGISYVRVSCTSIAGTADLDIDWVLK